MVIFKASSSNQLEMSLKINKDEFNIKFRKGIEKDNFVKHLNQAIKAAKELHEEKSMRSSTYSLFENFSLVIIYLQLFKVKSLTKPKLNKKRMQTLKKRR